MVGKRAEARITCRVMYADQRFAMIPLEQIGPRDCFGALPNGPAMMGRQPRRCDKNPYLTSSTRRDNPGARVRRASHVSSVQSSASARAT
jgi:hypothetical protein